MPCYYPIDAWISKSPNENGRYPLVFNRSEAQQDAPIKSPCGKCIGCKLDRSQEWAIRASHEIQLHDDCCYITLTYNDENLPPYGSINRRDFKNFIKRLRREYPGVQIRFMACSEYGAPEHGSIIQGHSNIGRPHFHAILFGIDLDDKKRYKQNEAGDMLYTSAKLEKLWGKGFATIGEANKQSAGYIAGYTTKKITGEHAEEHYALVTPQGEYIPREPESLIVTTQPGIGHGWYQKFKTDLQKGFITDGYGSKQPVPSYYLKLARQEDTTEIFDALKEMNREKSDPLNYEMSNDRLRVKETVRKARIKGILDRNRI